MFKVSEQLGEVKNVLKKKDNEFTVNFVPIVEQAQAIQGEDRQQAATTSHHDVSEFPAKRKRTDTNDSSANSLHQQLPPIMKDALIEAFERLDFRALYKLAMVCESFRLIAIHVFQTKYKEKPFEFIRVYGEKASLSRFEEFLQMFSPTCVDSLPGFDRMITSRALAEYCPNLEELNIDTDGLEPETITALQPILPKLRKIKIAATGVLNNIDVDNSIDWRIEELYIRMCDNPVMPTIRMPRLCKLHFKYLSNDAQASAMFEFLAGNDQARVLKFKRCTISWDRLCELPEKAPNVKKLTFSDTDLTCEDDEMPPGRFECLRKLKIESCEQTDRIMDSLQCTQLKRLRLDGYINNKNLEYPIERICGLSTISRLHLDLMNDPVTLKPFRVSENDLIQLATSLKCLRELFIAKGTFTLGCIRDILMSFNGIIQLDVGLAEEVNVDWTMLNDISAIVAARSDLRVKTRVSSRHLRVSEKPPDSDFVRASFQLLIALV